MAMSIGLKYDETFMHGINIERYSYLDNQGSLQYSQADISNLLSTLISELDSEDITAIVLTGSYTRNEGTQYSDLDIKLIASEQSSRVEQSTYFYRSGYLVNVATHFLSTYRNLLTIPGEALFTVPSLREARILVDKEGVFKRLQQEAMDWSWEPLQPAANEHAGKVLEKYIEYIHKILRAFLLEDRHALSEMVAGVLAALTEAVIVQHGVLARSGNSYYVQAEESVGIDSTWSRYHRFLADLESSDVPVTVETKGAVALKLYVETFRLLEPALLPSHRATIKQATEVIEHAMPQLPNMTIKPLTD